MENRPVERLFKAISNDDEVLLGQCLKTASIETILEFEKIHGESPAHLCVKLAGPNCLVLVKHLYASGLVDGDVRDSKGRTIVHYALANAEQMLAKELISMEIEGLDDATACYRMMRGGSTDVFKLYLSMYTNWKEREKFHNIASALVKINVKNIILPEGFRVFLEWKLSDYGYRQLAGDWKGVKDPREWRSHLGIIADCWKVVSDNYDTRRYDDVDDQLLHRLEVIHNHLYLLKHKRFLGHLPLQEAIFCLAIFVSIYKSSEQFHVYRMLVNKCFVVDILRMICRQLVHVERNVADAERELISRVGNINELGETKKQLLIEAVRERLSFVTNPPDLVNRILLARENGHTINEAVAEAVSNEAFDMEQLLKFKDRRIIRMLKKRCINAKHLHSLSRMLFYWEQISLLETLDPAVRKAGLKRVVQVLGELLRNMNESTEKMHVTPFPIDDYTLNKMVYDGWSLNQHPTEKEGEENMLKTITSLFGDAVRVSFQLLYVAVFNKALLTFFGLLYRCESIESMRSLVAYVGDLDLMVQKRDAYVEPYRQFFTDVKIVSDHGLSQRGMKLLEAFECGKQPMHKAIRSVCNLSNDTVSVRRVIVYFMTKQIPRDYPEQMFGMWQTAMSEFNYADSRLRMVKELEAVNVKRRWDEHIELVRHTYRLLKKMDINESVVDVTTMLELNELLKPYYYDSFALHKKWDVLKQFIEQRNLKWNENNAKHLLELDKERLQQLFDERRKDLQQLLQAHGLSTVNKLSERLHNLRSDVRLAIEFSHLQLCRMLVAAGYFGDRCSKYGKFLHDPFSYNLLTSSSMQTDMIVINAYVIANNEIRLFDKHETQLEHPAIHLPTTLDCQRWVDEQEQLMEAFRDGDVNKMYELMQRGSSIRSKFCCSASGTTATPCLLALTSVVNPNATDLMVQLLKRYFDNSQLQAFQSGIILEVRERLLRWPRFMPALRHTQLFVKLTAESNRFSILRELIRHGNDRSITEILSSGIEFSEVQCGELVKEAIECCDPTIAHTLLHRPCELDLQHWIRMVDYHWNEIFFIFRSQIFNHLNAKAYSDVLFAALNSQNYTVAEILLKTKSLQKHIPASFLRCGGKIATSGQTKILRLMLELHRSATDDQINQIMEEASPTCSTFLLSRGIILNKSNFERIIQRGWRRVLEKAKANQFDSSNYANGNDHPFAVALRNNTASSRMVRCLKRFGFDWLDNSKIMQDAILHSNDSSLEILWQKLYECHLVLSEEHRKNHCKIALNAFNRWKAIGFVEESPTKTTTLMCAVDKNDENTVQAILDHARKSRTIDGFGVLAGIAFAKRSSCTSFGKRLQKDVSGTHGNCLDLIAKFSDHVSTEEKAWSIYKFDIGFSVTFAVLVPSGERFDNALLKGLKKTLKISASLQDNLTALKEITRKYLNEIPVTHVECQLPSGCSRHFWRIKDTCCIFDILEPGSIIDLTATLNYPNDAGKTPLHISCSKAQYSLVQKLVNNGANPLLEDDKGENSIDVSLDDVFYPRYPIGSYLFDECIARDLQNAKGESIKQYAERKRLLMLASMHGRSDIFERLLRLKVNVTVPFRDGQSAVHIITLGKDLRYPRMTEMLLEYKPSLVNVRDSSGNTTMHCAAQTGSIEMLNVLLKYRPNIKLVGCNGSPLAVALKGNRQEFAWHLLAYAVENGIEDLTRQDTPSSLGMAFFNSKFELSKALLEYEIGHSLDAIERRDLPFLKYTVKSMITQCALHLSKYDKDQQDETTKFMSYLMAKVTLAIVIYEGIPK